MPHEVLPVPPYKLRDNQTGHADPLQATLQTLAAVLSPRRTPQDGGKALILLHPEPTGATGTVCPL